MSYVGIARGLKTIVTGVIDGDVVKVGKGIAGTAVSSAGTAITTTISEEIGERLSETGEQINEDEA